MNNEFYRLRVEEIFPDGITPALMTTDQLQSYIDQGVEVYDAFYPPKNGAFQMYGMLILAAVAAGGLAVYLAGTTAAGTGAVTATTEAVAGSAVSAGAGASTAAAGTVASTAVATKTATIGVQQIAGYLGTASTVAQKLGVKNADKLALVSKGIRGLDNIPDRLDAAADFFKSGDFIDEALMFGTDQYLQRENKKIVGEQARLAQLEEVNRQRMLYENYLRRQAQEMRINSGQPQKEPVSGIQLLSIVTPFALYFLNQ